MPASRIIADTGSSVNEIGNSIATVVTGPMPGSTPTTVPRNTPSTQYRTFLNDSATLNPRPSEERTSMRGLKLRPHRQRQPEAVYEDGDGEDRQGDGERRDLQRLRLPAGERGDDDHDNERDDEAQPLQQRAE